MTTNVTISQIYWNKRSLGSFFFRDQAMNTLEDLCKRSALGIEATLQALNDQTKDTDLDDFEEDLYSYSTEDIADAYGIELETDEDEDED